MPDKKRTAADKRTKHFRDCTQADDFIKDWERLDRSGKHDMHRLKEAMMLIVANDAPLPPEWKDHSLSGQLKNYRECHIKGDLLLVYEIRAKNGYEAVAFARAGTHSELFK